MSGVLSSAGGARLGAAVLCGGAAALLGVMRLRARAYDTWRWLEEVDGEAALGWVRARNAALPFDGRGALFERLKKIFDSTDKIPFVDQRNGQLYNFWKDEVAVRGVWRRTSLESYRTAAPSWTTLLDLDALSASEGRPWVFKEVMYLEPPQGSAAPTERALLMLSPGGGDAVEIREWDVVRERFVPAAEQPFFLSEAKTRVAWKDRDTLLVGTDFGPGSMTSSGYARLVKEWKRGTPLAAARTVFEGAAGDVSVGAAMMHERGGVRLEMVFRMTSFYTSDKVVLSASGLPGLRADLAFPVTLSLPSDMKVETFADQALLRPRSDFLGFKSGSVLALPMATLLNARSAGDIAARDLVPLFEPSATVALADLCKTKSHVLLVLQADVKSKLEAWRYEGGGRWARLPTQGAEGAIRSLHAWPVDALNADTYWMTEDSFVQPTTLLMADASGRTRPEKLKNEIERFTAGGIEMSQHFATSADGTKVPYFQVGTKAGDGAPRPTLLYGYGGFEIPLQASYQVTTGVAWLEKGNVYVMANIRGGGEYGPAWHQAALKASRHKAYEDFEAIARDLVRRGVTTHKQLGCCGGSNGGLLTGNMLTRSPELWGAVIIMVPLLDMKRFNKLLAGASWMAEYGNPDTEDWDNFLHKYSPYHNLKPGTKYPPVLFQTSTRDDRVHPGHARKMAAKMIDMFGANNVLYWENTEGGHGGASTNAQRAEMWTVAYQFLTASLPAKV